MEEVALQNLPQTRAAGSSYHTLVGRILLQIFITTTLHHRWTDLGSYRVASAWLG